MLLIEGSRRPPGLDGGEFCAADGKLSDAGLPVLGVQMALDFNLDLLDERVDAKVLSRRREARVRRELDREGASSRARSA